MINISLEQGQGSIICGHLVSARAEASRGTRPTVSGPASPFAVTHQCTEQQAYVDVGGIARHLPTCLGSH